MNGNIVEHLEKAPLTRFHHGLLLIGKSSTVSRPRARVHFVGPVDIILLGIETKRKVLEEISKE